MGHNWGWIFDERTMLKELKLTNFTVFPEAKIKFAPGLNVIVGENGCGKTHLLKLAYCMNAVGFPPSDDPMANPLATPTKAYLQGAYAKKISNVFRAEQLGRLASRIQGQKRCKVGARYSNSSLNCSFSFAHTSKSEVQVDNAPKDWQDKFPVYLPTRELLTIYPNFVALYEKRYLDLEETWRDTCSLLGDALVKGPREKKVSALLQPLEEAMGGKVVLDRNGRFYLSLPGQGNMEMPLVAEGLRKFAMLARLIATENLLDKGTLFWDEPEANLNPRLIRVIAGTLVGLASSGIQVIAATHSYFLMKEIELLAQGKKMDRQFIGLNRRPDGPGVIHQQSDSLLGLDHVAALDEELAQYDRDLQAQSNA